MFCTKCGLENEDSAKFCADCGNPLVKNYVNEQQSNQMNKGNPTLVNNYKKIIVDENSFSLKNSRLGIFTLSSNIDTSNVKITDYQNEYSQLGGFLALIVYGGIISLILSFIAFMLCLIFSEEGLLPIASHGLWPYFTPQFLIVWLIRLAATIFSLVLLFRFFIKIKHADIDFLHFYHKTCIVLTILLVANFILTLLLSMSYSWVYYFDLRNILSLWYLASYYGTPFLLIFVFFALSVFLFTLYFVKSVRVRTFMGTDMYLKLSIFTQNIRSVQPATFQNYQEANNQSLNQSRQKQNTYSNDTLINNNTNIENSNNNSNVVEPVFCTKCGSKIIEDDIFCTSCGNRVK